MFLCILQFTAVKDLSYCKVFALKIILKRKLYKLQKDIKQEPNTIKSYMQIKRKILTSMQIKKCLSFHVIIPLIVIIMKNLINSDKEFFLFFSVVKIQITFFWILTFLKLTYF